MKTERDRVIEKLNAVVSKYPAQWRELRKLPGKSKYSVYVEFTRVCDVDEYFPKGKVAMIDSTLGRELCEAFSAVQDMGGIKCQSAELILSPWLPGAEPTPNQTEGYAAAIRSEGVETKKRWFTQHLEEKNLKLRLEIKHNLTEHPKRDLLYKLAWDEGHSSGLSEVEIYYDNMAELLK